jgi:hypothetical protein
LTVRDAGWNSKLTAATVTVPALADPIDSPTSPATAIARAIERRAQSGIWVRASIDR